MTDDLENDIEYFKQKLERHKQRGLDTSVLEKQIELLEDAIVVYRIGGAPGRRVFQLDVGDMTPEEASAKIDDIKKQINASRSVSYKYTSTKEYHNAFPCAYRQWKADSHCSKIHGYSFSMKFYFGTNDLDARNWAADYGGLKELKSFLEDRFDHTLLVSSDDPQLDWYREAERRGMAKLTVLPKLGCEGLADMLYCYVNGVFIPEMWGQGESERLWCYRVEVRETLANMAFREGHREWNEDLFAGFE